MNIRRSIAEFARGAFGLLPLPDPAGANDLPAISLLSPFRTHAGGYADFFQPIRKISATTARTKRGGYTRTYHVAGADLSAADTLHRNVTCERVNRALLNVGEGWIIQVDLDHRRADKYTHEERFVDRASWLVAEERRTSINEGRHFVHDSYWTLTYNPPPIRARSKAKARSIVDELMFANADPRDLEALKTFEVGTQRITQSLSGVMDFEVLGHRSTTPEQGPPVLLDDQLAWYLLCAQRKRQPVRAIDHDVLINEYIAGTTLDTFLPYLRIGANVLARPLTVVGFPERITPDILDMLMMVDIDLRATWRFVGTDRERARREIRKIRGFNMQQTQSAVDVLLTKGGTNADLVDEHKVDLTNDAQHAAAVLSKNYATFGLFSLVITLYQHIDTTSPLSDADRTVAAMRELQANYEHLSGLLTSSGFSVSDDWGDERESFLSTMPAEGITGVVKGHLASRAFADFIPTTFIRRGKWTADEKKYGPNQPPLAIFLGHGVVPVAFNFDFGTRGGHSLVVGETGAGKTTLVGFLMNAHRKYIAGPYGARQIVIDREHQHEIHALAVGGAIVPLSPKSDVRFAPFIDVDTEEGLDWAVTFCSHLLDRRGCDPRLHVEEIYVGLKRLSLAPPEQRTMTGLLISGALSTTARDALQTFARGGPAGTLFEGQSDEFEVNDFILFDTAEIGKESILYSAVMLMLDRAISRLCDGVKPHLIVAEEFWDLLNNEITANIFTKSMRTKRRRKGDMLLITQSYDDLYSTKYARALIDATVNRFILPSSALIAKGNDKHWDDLNLPRWRREQLASLEGRQEKFAYIMRPDGDQLVNTTIGPVARATVGKTDIADVNRVHKMIHDLGSDWYAEWVALNYPNDTDREGWRAHAYFGPPQPIVDLAGAVHAPTHAESHPDDPLGAGLVDVA